MTTDELIERKLKRSLMAERLAALTSEVIAETTYEPLDTVEDKIQTFITAEAKLLLTAFMQKVTEAYVNTHKKHS